jgi:tetratricopeptide (TPR) repeat protein
LLIPREGFTWRLRNVTGVFLCLALMTGCASLSTGFAPLRERDARKNLDTARRSMEQGEYAGIVPVLLQTISTYPETSAGHEAHYYLGIAHSRMGSYPDAIAQFNEYLRDDPKGRFAADCRAEAENLAKEREKKSPSLETINTRIAEQEESLNANPASVETRKTLADLFWQRGDYEKAGQLYIALAKEQPELRNDESIRARLEFGPDGNPIVLTPQEVIRRENEREPLIIINQASFRSGRDSFTQEHRNYVVSGQALNRGDSVLYGAQVTITLFAFDGMVYDTNTVNIGRLNPREARAFSVRFSNFDNIENISKFECVASFQR